MDKNPKNKRKFWSKRRVLVTGANGFIGSWLILALLEYGAEIVAFIKEEIPNPIFNQKERTRFKAIIKADLGNYRLFQDTFKRYKIDTCFHLAAQPLVGFANKSPLPTFTANIEGTWNILEAARKVNLARLIVASADKAYGEQEKLPYRESAPLRGRHPYGASKACADILSRTYAHTFNLAVAVTRCSNVYGGGDLNFSRIVPDTIRSVLNGKAPVIRSDGRSLRDYIFIQDIVEAYLTLAEGLDRDEARGGAFNFGSGRPISVLGIVKKIIKISQRNYLKPIILGKSNPGGKIDKQFLCIEKAKEILGWQPRYSLEEGLRLTIDWYSKKYEK
jgi:CDP-glucose 4,6-dehydratase